MDCFVPRKDVTSKCNASLRSPSPSLRMVMIKIKQQKMTVINRLFRSQMFIDKIVLFQRTTPSGSYKNVNTIFHKHVIISELIRYFITSLAGTKQSIESNKKYTKLT